MKLIATEEMLRAVNTAHQGLPAADWIDDLKHLQCTMDALAPFFAPSAIGAPSQHRYAAPFKMYGKPEEWVQTRFVSSYHIKDSPTEANPSPIRVIILGDLERAQPHAMAFGGTRDDS